MRVSLGRACSRFVESSREFKARRPCLLTFVNCCTTERVAHEQRYAICMRVRTKVQRIERSGVRGRQRTGGEAGAEEQGEEDAKRRTREEGKAESEGEAESRHDGDGHPCTRGGKGTSRGMAHGPLVRSLLAWCAQGHAPPVGCTEAKCPTTFVCACMWLILLLTVRGMPHSSSYV
jgi:hypothetical protein